MRAACKCDVRTRFLRWDATKWAIVGDGPTWGCSGITTGSRAGPIRALEATALPALEVAQQAARSRHADQADEDPESIEHRIRRILSQRRAPGQQHGIGGV